MGDKERRQLFTDHEHLIPKLAKKFRGYGKTGVEYEDLFQEAALGLHLATLDFKPEKWEGKTFESYAVTRIYQSMMGFFQLQNKLCTPRYVVVLAAKIRRENLRDHTPAEIAKILDERETSVERALIHLDGVHFVGFDEPAGDDKNHTLSEKLEDVNNICAIEHTAFELFREGLSDREQRIFEMMLQEKQYKHIGDVMGFSRVYAGRLVNEIKDKYKKYNEVG